MVDKILKMYETEMKTLATLMEQTRNVHDMSRYYELSMKYEELSELFNKTIVIINEECAR